MTGMNTRRLISIATLGLLAACGVPTAAGQDNPQVCPGTHIDPPGDPTSITISAPAGQLIAEVCVKAGSAEQGDGPEIIVFDPPQATVTFEHPSGKEISHYTVTYTPVPTTTTAKPTTTTAPTTTTTTTAVTTSTSTTGPTTTTPGSTTTSTGPTTTSTTTPPLTSPGTTTSSSSTSTVPSSSSTTTPTTTTTPRPPTTTTAPPVPPPATPRVVLPPTL